MYVHDLDCEELGELTTQVDLHTTMLKKLLQTVAPPKIKAQNCGAPPGTKG